MKYYLLLILLLVSCGGADDNNHGYGYEYTDSASSGLKIRRPDNDKYYLSIETYNNWYSAVQDCTNIHKSGPLIVFVPDRIFGTYHGYTYSDGLILILNQYHEDGWIVKHEFIHYLTGDSSHSSPYFGVCEN